MLNIESYKQRLLAEERELLDRMKRAQKSAREANAEVQDWGDEVVTDELEDDSLLKQVLNGLF